MNNNTITVGILSDSHGFLDPRIAETVNLCDHIVHAGDIFNAHVLSQLKPAKQLIAVAGNNDFSDFWKDEEANDLKIRSFKERRSEYSPKNLSEKIYDRIINIFGPGKLSQKS